MKQADIKARRYYSNKGGSAFRYVTEIDVGKVWYRHLSYTKADEGTFGQSLKSFARWADSEVMPVYDTVVRCPHCDAWDWWGTVGTTEVCHNCEKTYEPKA